MALTASMSNNKEEGIHFCGVYVCVKLLHLVSQRQRAVDVQTVVALQLQQRVSQKFL